MKLSKKALAKSRVFNSLSFTIAAISVATFGLLFSVASIASADSPKGNWTDLGTAAVAGSQDNQAVTAYACTKQVSNVLWKVKAKFTLADSYKTVNDFNWTATITNTGTDPIKDDQFVSANFKDTLHPHVRLNIDTYPPVSSPLTFSYEAGSPSLGTTVSGNIAQNVLPQDLVECSN